jgi:4-diphosphocytidyl-2-C-methyl-D-erythritol kinase
MWFAIVVDVQRVEHHRRLSRQLFRYLLRRNFWVRSTGNRTADHEIISSRVDGFAGRGKAFLIAGVRPSRTNSRCDNLDFVAKFRAQHPRFMGARDQTIDAVGHAEAREPQDLVAGLFGDSDLSQGFVRRTRQDGNAEQKQVVTPRADGGADHFAAAAQMQSQHAHSEFAGCFHRFRDRVRNVVQLEIEKHLRPEERNGTDKRRPFRRVVLQANLEQTDIVSQQTGQSQRFLGRRHIERDDDLLGGWRFHSVVLRCLLNKLQDMQVFAPAKINLSFRIKDRRADGFHEIETLMAPISLADRITIERAGDDGEIRFTCDDPSLPAGDDNLVVRAAKLFCQRADIASGITIALEKKIPHGAGLGGGSSDAASTLLALNELFAADLSQEDLLQLAAQLGSDVPFFIVRSAAVCRGRGEIVELTALSTELRLVLFKPDFAVPTPWAYGRWKDSRELPGVDYSPQEFNGTQFVNDLERPVFEKFVLLAQLKNWLRQQREVAVALMSGSGSTVFAVVREGATGEALAARARSEIDATVWTCDCEATQTFASNSPPRIRD